MVPSYKTSEIFLKKVESLRKHLLKNKNTYDNAFDLIKQKSVIPVLNTPYPSEMYTILNELEEQFNLPASAATASVTVTTTAAASSSTATSTATAIWYVVKKLDTLGLEYAKIADQLQIPISSTVRTEIINYFKHDKPNEKLLAKQMAEMERRNAIKQIKKINSYISWDVTRNRFVCCCDVKVSELVFSKEGRGEITCSCCNCGYMVPFIELQQLITTLKTKLKKALSEITVLSASDRITLREICRICNIYGSMLSHEDENIYSTVSGDINHVMRSQTAAHDYLRHYKIWLDRILFKDAESVVSKNISEFAMVKCKIDSLPKPVRVSIPYIRDLLKRMSLSKINDLTSYILVQICKIDLPTFTPAEIEEVNMLFMRVITVYDKVKPKKNNNRIFYPYYIYKILQLYTMAKCPHKWPILCCIHLQSEKTLESHDMVWKDICKFIEDNNQNENEDIKIEFIFTDRTMHDVQAYQYLIMR